MFLPENMYIVSFFLYETTFLLLKSKSRCGCNFFSLSFYITDGLNSSATYYFLEPILQPFI